MRTTLVLALTLCTSTAALAGAPRRISLELHNAELHSVLRLFAEVGRFNLVTSEEVSGKVTLKLRNVPWDEAFRVVVASKGLGVERVGSIVRVAPLSKLAEEAEARRKVQDAQLAERPLSVRLIPVNYANAEELAQQVKGLLSPRGTVSVDARTNTLIVRDVE
ncbi:MAG: secretin and TonB N-terminal domain-containing protein [Myxococcaceae bacterium]|nr:secretin and TonB N-terminal domain-containing protein [Myxococcaceae bacterium]